MINPLASLSHAVRALGTLFFPMFAGSRAAEAEVSDPARRWAVRALPVSALLLLLWQVNRAETFGLREWIPYGRIGEFWLPVFAACLYAILWLGWWLYRVLSLGIEPLGSEFPDIDRAWERATQALAEAEIPIDSTPVFLVLGRGARSGESLFRAPRLKMKVKHVPSDPGEPVHVSANRDGIWVTCPGASAFGRFDAEGSDDVPDSTLSSLVDDSGVADSNRTYAAPGGGATVGIEDILKGGLKEVLNKSKSGSQRSAFDPERDRQRLRHLCRLIVRDRKGFCPVNGILILLPVSATAPKADAQDIAHASRTDLTVAHQTFRVRCPTLVMVCDLNTLEGFAELVERQPAGQVGNRRGQRFPLVPDLASDRMADSVQGAVEWITGTYFPSMISTSYQLETPGIGDLAGAIEANTRLFHLMTALRERQGRLCELVRDSLPTLPDEPLMFGGCYFAGTGDSPTEQAFASGVLQRMVEDQDYVTWTAEYLDKEASYRRTAGVAKVVLNLAIAVTAVVALVLIAMLVFPQGDAGGPDAGAP